MLELKCNRITEFVLVLEICVNVLKYMQEAQPEAIGLFPFWFFRVGAFIGPQFLLSDHTRLCSAVISLHAHLCTDLDALGRSGYNICSALCTVEWKLIGFHPLFAVLDLCIWLSPLFITGLILNLFPKLHIFSTTTVISHIWYPSLSLYLTAFLSLDSVNVVLSKLWIHHGVGSEATCPVFALVSDSCNYGASI